MTWHPFLVVAWTATALAPLRPGHRRQQVRGIVTMRAHAVWFSQDLRVEDHGGLRAVAMDPEATSWTALVGVPDACKGLQRRLLRRAAEELDAELEKRYGARLVVVPWEEAIEIARECDVVHSTRAVVEEVERWTAPLRPAAYEGSDTYDEYLEWAANEPRAGPLSAPEAMPPSTASRPCAWHLLDDDDDDPPSEPYADVAVAFCGCASAPAGIESYLDGGRTAFAREHFGSVGTATSLYAAAAAWVAGDAPAERLAVREPAERAFGAALALGTVSPRSVAAAAVRYGAAYPVSKLAGLGRSGAGALLDVVEWREWYARLKERRGGSWWAWGSGAYAIRYDAYNRGATPNNALLFVHGFGASADQWKRLAAEFPDVSMFAVDVLGFGYSAKPGLSYTQHLWEAMIEDFTRDVVLRHHDTVTLVGNSIGGGLCAGVAANLGDALCSGLVLCNTAGLILDSQADEDLVKSGASTRTRTLNVLLLSDDDHPKLEPFDPPFGGQLLLDVFGEAVIALLGPQIPTLLKRYYAINPDNADDHLAAAILRDSKDPGAANVIASGAKLPPQRSLNEALRDFGGPVLVPQGESGTSARA
ncbi:hypothetical protein CTAYLR_006352 [Chrysophaeum taylorii]|uniref:Photolyase/cryptochrome alpha/beta domain-containing protein n=1 Tax=Chrysophaeum taylorii TaxID=2483200 RepID=A0AAD7XI80_9STRA|nr:hypothetical protein CTAYLR_006352 [Chrysophaeum taylorii]